MPAIEKLKIKGFKAFPNEFELKLDGKHLLLYGENGSGKSSIYYALHCLYQSPLKDDTGKKYFNRTDAHGNPNNQHLINLNIDTDDSKISLIFDSRHPFIYEIDKNGYNTHLHGGGMPLPGNVAGSFINHKFIFNFFHFHNSEYINLFPVFEKDILPYCYVKHGAVVNNIGKQYEQTINYISKNGKRVNKQHHENIRIFNENLEAIINGINLEISDIYNDHFRDADCNNLRIKLYYGRATDHKVLNGYWLKYDYLRFLAYDNGIRTEKTNSYRSHNDPFIRLDVEEEVEPNVYRVIEKPQTYFNEAKLTAIALSIRFALLDRISPADGRFMALDDMLISLDMSNRTKVVDFLLSIADKYKIYLFTHDLNFYDLVKKKIEKEYNKKQEWMMGKLYMNDFKEIPFPEFFPENNKIIHAKQFLTCHDYPACGIYLRRECESILDSLFPDSLKKGIKKDDVGNDLTFDLNLNDKILNLDKFCKKENIYFDRFKSIKTYKDVVLNALAHNDSTSPIFKAELRALIISLEELQKIKRGEVILKNSKDPSINFIAKGKNIAICLRTREHIVLIEENGVKRLSNYGRCEVTKIIEDGVDKAESEAFDSLNDAYMYYCNKYEKAPDDNLIDVIMYRGNPLKDKL